MTRENAARQTTTTYFLSRPLAKTLALLLAALGLALPVRAQMPVVEAKNADEATVLQMNDDGGLLGLGVFGMGVIPAEGAGVRLMWYPAKAAFRAGRVGVFSDGSEWDDANVGTYSVAFGRSTTASASVSTAMGFQTTAQAYASLVIGRYNVIEGNGGDWVPTDPLFVAGNGSFDSPSNALTLLKNGNLTIAGTLTENSDRRLKTAITPLESVLAALDAIQPVRYRFKDSTSRPSGPQLGLIAQEVQQVFPELVSRGADGYLSVAYPKLTAVLLKGLQEQQDRIDTQQTQIQALEARLAAVEQGRTAHALASMAGPAGAAALLALLLLGGLALWRRRHTPLALPIAFLSTAIGAVTALNATPVQAQTVTVQNGATLYITGGGVLDLHGSTLDLGDAGETARLEEADGGRVTGGLLTATRALSSPSGADPAGLGAVITSDQALGATTITRGHAVQVGGTNQGIQRYYDIAPETRTPLGAALVFRYNDAELGGLPEKELVLFRSADDGRTWRLRGADSRDEDANTVTLSGIDAFSRWTLGASSQPLPVELTAFEAALDGEAVQLTWATASETNNAGFHVERAVDRPSSEEDGTDNAHASEDVAWQAVGFVEGAGTTSTPQRYRFRVSDPGIGAHRFRLQQVDLDGAFAYSEEVEVRVTLAEPFRISAIYPNPFAGHAAVDVIVRTTQPVRAALYDLLGRRVAIVHDGAVAANQTVRLASGVYLLRIVGDDFAVTRRVTLVR